MKPNNSDPSRCVWQGGDVPALFNQQFAVNEPPYSTSKQRTRWSTQDDAYHRRLAGLPQRILSYLSSAPSTCDEVEVALTLTHQSASAAINLLMNAGAVVAVGKRKTRSGRSARVWEATHPKGRK